VGAPADCDHRLRLIATIRSEGSRPPIPGIATRLWTGVTDTVG
jgi:hypothetical protein